MEQPFLGNDQRVPIAEENTALPLAPLGGKGDIRHYDVVRLDFETLPGVCPAECAFVMRTPHGGLEQDAVGFAWRPDHIAFVMHIKTPKF